MLDEIYGIKAEASDFTPFAGTGEANFLGGVAKKHGVNIDIAATKRRYFELYLETASRPDYKIGYAGKHCMILKMYLSWHHRMLCCRRIRILFIMMMWLNTLPGDKTKILCMIGRPRGCIFII